MRYFLTQNPKSWQWRHHHLSHCSEEMKINVVKHWLFLSRYGSPVTASQREGQISTKSVHIMEPLCWFMKINYHSTIGLYDAVSDLMHNWVPQRPDFKSALRVVKMVLNTQCYQYLWLTMWFHAKNQNLWFYNVNSAPPDSEITKITQKNFALNDDLLTFFFIGMVYFICYLVNPHVQAAQKMCAKG